MPQVYPDIEKLDRSILRNLKGAVESRLTIAPESYGKPLRYSKKGLWSLRCGDYRVVYRIAAEEVWILRMGHRKEVYD